MISSLRAMLELAQLGSTPLAARIPASRMSVGNVPAGVDARTAALTINRALGTRDPQIRAGSERFNVRTWGSSRDEAESHYLALVETFGGLRAAHLASGAVLYRVELASAGQHLTDPDTGWPFVFSGWDAMFSETTVSS